MRPALLLLLIIAGARAFCEPFEGVPSVCLDLIPIGTPVWINPNTTQADVGRALEVNTNLIPLVGQPCADPAVFAACLSQFRVCGSDDLPRSVCREICSNFVGNCSSIPTVAARLPNCSMDDAVIPGEMLYQESRPSFNSTGVEECSRGARSVSVGCGGVPLPFDFNPKAQECQLTCPRPTLNITFNLRAYNLMFKIVWPISLLCQLYIFVPWAVQFRIDNPFYPIFFIVATISISIGYLPNVVYEQKDWICYDDFTVRSQHNTVGCGFSGAFLHFGVLTAATSITVILYHLLNVVNQQKWQIFGTHKLIPVHPLWGYTAFTFGTPLIFVIITAASMGYNAETGIICVPDIRKWNRWAFDGVFFLPIALLVILDVFLAIPMFMMIWRLGSWRAFRSQVRLIALCVYYWVVMVYGEAYQLYSKILYNGLQHDVAAYVQCVLGVRDSTGALLYPPPVGGICYDYINPKLWFWGQWLSQFLGMSTGVAVLFIFSRMDLLRVWLAIFTCKWKSIGKSGSATEST